MNDIHRKRKGNSLRSPSSTLDRPLLVSMFSPRALAASFRFDPSLNFDTVQWAKPFEIKWLDTVGNVTVDVQDGTFLVEHGSESRVSSFSPAFSLGGETNIFIAQIDSAIHSYLWLPKRERFGIGSSLTERLFTLSLFDWGEADGGSVQSRQFKILPEEGSAPSANIRYRMHYSSEYPRHCE